jgi:hypothetical protein
LLLTQNLATLSTLNPKFLFSKVEASLQISVTNNTSKSIHMEKQNRNKVFPPAFPNLAHFFSRIKHVLRVKKMVKTFFANFSQK